MVWGENHTSPSNDHWSIFTWPLAIAVVEGREWIGLVSRGRWGKAETFICSDHKRSATTVPVRPDSTVGLCDWLLLDLLWYLANREEENTWYKNPAAHTQCTTYPAVFSPFRFIEKEFWTQMRNKPKNKRQTYICLWNFNKNTLEAQLLNVRCNEGIFACIE